MNKDREKKDKWGENEEDERRKKDAGKIRRRRNDNLLHRVKGYKGREKKDALWIERFYKEKKGWM